nr:hypothetical protein [Polycipiviridae sp.]
MPNHFKLAKPDTQPNKASKPGFNQTQDYSNYPGDYSMSGKFGFKQQGKYDLAKQYDNYFQLKNQPGPSGTNLKSNPENSSFSSNVGSKHPLNPTLQSRSVGAVAKAASSKTSGASSNTKTSMAQRSTGVLGKLVGATVNVANNRMNLRNQASVSENFFNNQLGRGDHVNSPHFHAGHHADMAFNAQTQTIREQQNIQQSWSNMLGPVGGVIGHFRSRNHVSDLERNLNFKTATDTRGNAINPAESRNNAQIASNPSTTARSGESLEMTNFSKDNNKNEKKEAETSFTDTGAQSNNMTGQITNNTTEKPAVAETIF